MCIKWARISLIHQFPHVHISSVQVLKVSDSLRPNEPQHARPPCPLRTPRVDPNPCPLSQWCHLTISSSVVPFSSCPQSFPASGSFQMRQLFPSGDQRIGVSASTSVLPMNTQDWSWELEYKESWALKNWCFWTVVLENTLESALDCKEIKPVNPKGNKSWIFIGRTDVKAEAPIFWPPDVKNWLIGKDTEAGKDWRQVKGMTEDEMVGWHHPLNMSLSKLWELVMDREVWHASVQGVTRSWTWLSDWTELNWWGWKRRVEKLAWNSTLKKLRSWHQVPSRHRK